MKYIGYNRVSTKSQHIETGIKQITKFCEDYNYRLEKVYADQQTGKNFDRPRYIVMKEDVLYPGDVLIITAIDRLGRNTEEILRELQYYQDKDVRVMILELPTTLMRYDELGSDMAKTILKAVNKLLIEILAVQAQTELQKRETRQKEGIQAMKDRGEWDRYGRKRVLSIEDFEREYKNLVEGKIKPFELMRKLKLKTTTYYRYKKIVDSKYIAK
jgi:DNA invertase Pin-like site-specific DNA recombinase